MKSDHLGLYPRNSKGHHFFFRGAADLQYEGQAAAGRPPDLPGGGCGQVEVQVLLPVRVLQEVQSS